MTTKPRSGKPQTVADLLGADRERAAEVKPLDDSPKALAQAEQKAVQEFSRQVRLQQFAALYVEHGFSAQKAYQAMRPNATPFRARKMSAKWLLDRRTRDAIVRLVEPTLSRASRQFDNMMRQIEAEMNADIYDFMEEGEVPIKVYDHIEYATGVRYKVNPHPDDKLMRRTVRSIRLVDGQIQDIKLADKSQARRQYMAVMDRLIDLERGKNSKGSGLSSVLRNRLAKAKEVQTSTGRKLPNPPNVADLRVIEGALVPATEKASTRAG